MRRAKTKIRKIKDVYSPEIFFMQKKGLSLRKISKELYSRHKVKISFNYLSEILKPLTPPE